MEAAAQEAFTPAVREQTFTALGLVESEWQDLGGFESFVYANSAQNVILRMTHLSHRSKEDLYSELEFVDYLYRAGAAVCAPIAPQRPETPELWVEQIGDFVCSSFQQAPGRRIEQTDWTPELFYRWGAAIGQFHRLAGQYEPSGPKRFDWSQDENLDFRGRIPAQQDRVLSLGDAYLSRLQDLPVRQDCYGLIHSDAHVGNFHLAGKQLRFFDFDDCCYQWFAFDVGTILFSAILQQWMADSQTEREAEAKLFFPHFLEGYASEFEVSDFLLEVLPLFLKLRELSLYAVIHSHMDVNQLEDWYPIKFMTGRQERIEQDLPYLDIDFSKL